MKNKVFIRNNIGKTATAWSKPSVVVALMTILFFGASCNKFLDVRPEGELIEKELLVDAKSMDCKSHYLKSLVMDLWLRCLEKWSMTH